MTPSPIEAIQVDTEARYIIVVNGDDDPAMLADLEFVLTEWWNSDAPFCVVAGYDGTTIRFERVKGNDNGRLEVEDGSQLPVGSQRDAD